MDELNHEKQLIKAITDILNVKPDKGKQDDRTYMSMHQSMQLVTIRVIVERHNKRIKEEEK